MAAAAPLIRLDTDAGIAVATIDAPPLNLLGGELMVALDELGRTVADDQDVRVLVLRSAHPDIFIAHGDVSTMVHMARLEQPPEPPAELSFLHTCLDRFRTMPKVTIAQIEGFARGGGSEVALACDLRYAARRSARFGQPELGLGLIPGAGGTARLRQLVGRARAAEIIFGGGDHSADEAAALGWINQAVDDDALGRFVDGLAARIASFPATAIAEVKAALDDMEPDLPSHLRREHHGLDRCMLSDEPHRRMQRWLDLDFQTATGEATIGDRLEELAR